MHKTAFHIAVLSTAAMWAPIPARAASPPKLQEGLWEIRGQNVENPGAKRTDFTYRLCRDHAYDKAVNAQLKEVKGCTTVLKSLGSGKFALSSTCIVGAVTIASNALSEYKSDGSTHSETHATYTPPLNGKTDETLTQDQRYIGKCPAGTKPGDTIHADGIIRHHES